MTMTLETARAEFLEFLKDADQVCFFTGAGISTESGIPDFRSPGGIWSQYRIIEIDDFLTSEEARLEDWDRRFHMAELFDSSEPNAAHRFIAQQVRLGRSSGVITQNIDDLHRRAGLDEAEIVEFHGTGSYAHCMTCRKRHEIADMKEMIDKSNRSPRCSCGGYVKAAVVSFGEAIPQENINRSVEMIENCNAMVAIGSSLTVWPAAALLDHAIALGKPLAIINRDETPFDHKATLILNSSAAKLCESLL